jgi:hypothetical protein
MSMKDRSIHTVLGEDDSQLLLDALAYVTELYEEVTSENGAPTLGTQNQVVDFIRADPALSRYVRDWARTRSDEASLNPARRLPFDDAYQQIRAEMERAIPAKPQG